MTGYEREIRLLVLGELTEIDDLITAEAPRDSPPIRPLTLRQKQHFYDADLDDINVIVTDLRSLEIDLLDILRKAKQTPPVIPVVLIADIDQGDQVVEALANGLDAYVFRGPDSAAFLALLDETIRRSVARRQDLSLISTGEASRTHFWAFFDSLPIPAKVLDEEGRIQHANESMEEFLGYESKELKGKIIFEVMHNDEVTTARAIFADILHSAKAPDPTQMKYDHHDIADRRYLTSDGDVVWGDLYLIPLWDTDGSLLHIIGLMVDITERKNALQDLRDRERSERSILDTNVDGIITIDENGIIKSCNNACGEAFGYKKSDLKGQNIRKLILSTDHGILESSLTSDRNESERVEITGIHKNDETFPLELGVGSQSFQGQQEFTLVLRDISERAEFIERLSRSERMEAVGQLAGGIAHNFNNLLTIISSHAYLLQTLELDEHADEFITKILAATDRGAQLTNQLSTLRPTSVTDPAPLRLGEAITDLTGFLQETLPEDVDIKSNLATDLHFIKADLAQIEQVLLTLVINACDAMPGGGTITVETENITIEKGNHGEPTRGLSPGRYVVLRIRDTGSGIAPEHQGRIFDPYFSTKDKSVGMGLAAVASIVDSHCGVIDFETTPGRGTTFEVYFPAIEPKVETPDRLPSISFTDGSLNEKIILVAEDEEHIRSSLVTALKLDGPQVLAAADGDEALQLAKDHPEPIDLLLTDLVMPGIHGVELAEELRQIYPDIGVVFISGYASEILQKKDIRPGQIYVKKPFKIEDLKQKIYQMLI